MNNLRSRHAISIVLSLVGVGFALLGSTTSEILMWIGYGLIFVAIIINMTIRCPKCGRNLVRRRWTVPKFCPECGQAIGNNEVEE